MLEKAPHINLFFPKSERLTSKKSIEELFKKGSSFYFKPIVIKYSIASVEEDSSKLLIAVPKKFLRKAVHRNLIKRRIREVYRLNKGIIANSQPMHIAIIYQSKELLSYNTIQEKLINLLQRLEKIA